MSNKKITDFKQYIKDRVKIDSNNCWIWQLSLTFDGYGVAISNVKRASDIAHRIAYKAFTGPITNNLFVLHSCDVPACCNPKHLRLGTAQDNADDKVKRNRGYNNSQKCKETIFNKNGWVITPYGKFKTAKDAATKDVVCARAINIRIKKSNFPEYYREAISCRS